MKRLFLIICLPLMLCGAVHAQKEYHGDGIDDVMRFVPLASVFALKACGVESRSNWQYLVLNAGLSTAVTAASAYLMKHTVHDMRPDGTDNHALPSGHAALVFSGAHVLHKEYWNTSPWISVAGYAVAGLTAADRVRRNRHDWADVGAGAALGILSTELSYLLTRHLFPQQKKSMSMFLTPAGLTFSMTFSMTGQTSL